QRWRMRTDRLWMCVYWTALLAFFFWFAGGGLNAYFSPDDMQSLHINWLLGWKGLLKAHVLFFSTAYRPLGGVYFYGLYSLFGLNVTPYRVVALFMVTLNLFVLYCFARQLTKRTWIAVAAVALSATHPKLVLVYYSNAVIYDILCFTFLYGTLAAYLA